MKKTITFSMLLFWGAALLLSGCYEQHLVSSHANPKQIWLVNSTDKKIDVITLGGSGAVDTQGISLYVVSPGGSAKIMLPITDGLIITEAGSCREMLPLYFVLNLNEAEEFRMSCQALFTYTKQDLIEVSAPLLTKEYKTCVLLKPDGSLEAMTEHSTPWTDVATTSRTCCGHPQAEETLEYEPSTKTLISLGQCY